MKRHLTKRTLSTILVLIGCAVLVVIGSQIASSGRYPHETVADNTSVTVNPEITTTTSQETTSTSTTRTTTTTTSVTTTENQTVTETLQESSTSTASPSSKPKRTTKKPTTSQPQTTEPLTTELPTTVLPTSELLTSELLTSELLTSAEDEITEISQESSSSQEPSSQEPASSEEPSSQPAAPKPKVKGAAAITFDDGPGAHTARLLNALKQYDAKATFFVVGNRVANNKSLIQRMINEGHEVGNHSYSHRDLRKLSDANVINQLRNTNNAIAAITGMNPKVMRPPYGAFDRRVTRLAKQEGLALVLWTPSPQDWKYKDSDYVYNYIINNVKPGSTLLLHDIHKTTVDGFIRALPVLTERGIKLVTVSELVSLNPGDVHPSYWRK